MQAVYVWVKCWKVRSMWRLGSVYREQPLMYKHCHSWQEAGNEGQKLAMQGYGLLQAVTSLKAG